MRISAGIWTEDYPYVIMEAIDFAIEQTRCVEARGHLMGVDEILYGRAGLLWALLDIAKRCSTDPRAKNAFRPALHQIPARSLLCLKQANAAQKSSEQWVTTVTPGC